MQKSWKNQFTVNNCVWLWSGLKSVTNSKRASPKQRTISNWLTTSICSNADLKRTLSHPKHAPTTTKNDLSHSPHGVSPSCLNVWTDQLVPDFTQNCNRSLELFEAPSCFKCSIIIPVPSKKRHYCKWMTTGLLLWHLYTINTISQGAPQGCVLSPLLFPTAAASGHIKLCINHLHHLLKCRCPVITALMVIFACMLPFHYVHTLCIYASYCACHSCLLLHMSSVAHTAKDKSIVWLLHTRPKKMTDSDARERKERTRFLQVGQECQTQGAQTRSGHPVIFFRPWNLALLCHCPYKTSHNNS